MSFNGVLENVKFAPLVLTWKRGSNLVDGGDFIKTDNQRWVSDYEGGKVPTATLQNKESGDFLGWNADKKVVMGEIAKRWNVVFQDNYVGFQVPEGNTSDPDASAYYTLQLEADNSVILKYQESKLTTAQLWNPINK
ncbi:hypothetical protein EV702DRAFT_1279108 [Suillus placidus]|uniref:Uncharacterized protein n=1 Tax=Suillus placidus TaxID=48579 RepID=A0A9P6ZU88_9AGAM|nr:hypothetical protein EV702DRAFT_1279108 [Suillus placidus]